jgi:formate hydrogenlyase subunit 3/multisubunit Na+/H+ antiporter MnhD subunit
MKRRILILDKMVKINSILVGVSLILLFVFIAFLGDFFGMQNALVSSDFYDNYLSFLNSQQIDIFIIIFIPALGAGLELIYRDKNVKGRDRALVDMGLLVILLLILLYPKIVNGGIDYSFANVLMVGISFRIDLLGYMVLLVSSFVWFYVIVYAHEYMKKERHTTRFFFFLALTYGSVLGAIASGDLLTMFIFFEVMTVASYMLVIHGQNEDAYKAGYNYIIMGLIGGLLILSAIFLIYHYTGDLSFSMGDGRLDAFGSVKYWVMGLLVFGFGIKAGMAPVHVWLPRAHPVAPTPASAILSGVMIKVGAFGIIRTAISFYFPAFPSDAVWLTASNIGQIIIWTGIVTMFVGMILALQQVNIKKLLAYSSISQMGYILMGIGVAMYLKDKGAMGYTGAVYHIINHALFKSLLFMVAGVVYYHTKELNMYKLGGIWKRLPLTTIIFLIGMLGIIGFPLFNGYVSKTILHHAIVEAYHYGSNIYILAEILFIITSIGTVAYLSKMFYYVFIKDNKREYKHMTFDFSSLDLALLSVGIIIIMIGLFPNFILDQWIIPQINLLAYSPDFVGKYILDLNVFILKDIFMALGFILGGVIVFMILDRYKLFEIKMPKWLSLEYIVFYPAYLLMKNLCRMLYGDKCPYNQDEMSLLSEDDIEKVGFIDRFVITTNVLNRRYERRLIQADATIYVFFISFVIAFFVLLSLL